MSVPESKAQQTWARLRWPDWIQTQPLLRDSLQLLARHPGAWFAVGAISLLLFHFALVTAPSLIGWIQPKLSLAHQPELRIYLKNEVQAEYGHKVTELLGKLPVVASIHYLSSEQALRELKDEMGEEVVDGIEDNFLPASIAVRLRPVAVASDADRKSADAFTQAFAGRVRRLPGVETVDVLSRGEQREVSTDTMLLRGTSLIGGALLVLVLSLVLIYVARTTQPERRLRSDLGARPGSIYGPALICYGAVAVLSVCFTFALLVRLLPLYRQLHWPTFSGPIGFGAMQLSFLLLMGGGFFMLLRRKIA